MCHKSLQLSTLSKATVSKTAGHPYMERAAQNLPVQAEQTFLNNL